VKAKLISMTDSASTPLTAADSLPRLPAAKSLFSLHYLQTRLPEHAEWAADPQPVFEAVRRLWERARVLGGNWNEAQTEQEFVKPVLDALGWSYLVQVKAQRRGGSLTRPDYALFASQALADEVRNAPAAAGEVGRGIAQGLEGLGDVAHAPFVFRVARRFDLLHPCQQTLLLLLAFAVFHQQLHLLRVRLPGDELLVYRTKVIVGQASQVIVGQGRNQQLTQRRRIKGCRHVASPIRN